MSYGEENIRKQIKATADAGINSFILWNASAKYTLSALDPKDKSSDYPGETVYSINKPGNRSDGTKDAAAAKAFIDAYTAWNDGGRQGTFVPPGEAPAGGTTPATPGATPPSTPAPCTTPSASRAPSRSTTRTPHRSPGRLGRGSGRARITIAASHAVCRADSTPPGDRLRHSDQAVERCLDQRQRGGISGEIAALPTCDNSR